MYDITIYTIIYNKYGKFLKEWVKNAKKNKPKEIIVVLGKNHEAPEDIKGVKYIKCNSDVMGTLRNAAIKEIKTEYMLYFSVDDELYENATEQIDYKKDVTRLRYIDTENNVERTSAYYNILDVDKWNETTVPGYIAVKRVIKDKIMYYEDIEIPNYPYLFMLASNSCTNAITKDIVAKYRRREGSHGDRSKDKYIDFKSYINERAIYYKEQLKGCLVNIDYNDLIMKKLIERGSILENIYGNKLTEERKEYLKKIGFIKIKE